MKKINFMKHLILIIAISLLVLTPTFGQVIPANPSNIGITMPDSDPAWKRIKLDKDDIDNMVLSSKINITAKNSDDYYLSTRGEYEFIKFQFEGTDLRLSGIYGKDMPNNTRIIIDGYTELMPWNIKGQNNKDNTIVFERTGLKDGRHEVIIQAIGLNSFDYTLYLDDIALNKDGQLLSLQSTIGDKLAMPEKGWTRLDFSNPDYYDGDISKNIREGFVVPTPTLLNSSFFTQKTDTQFKFKFKGTQLRLLGTQMINSAPDVKISIDGVTETYSQESDNLTVDYALLYEKKGLEDKVHEVIITSSSKYYYNNVTVERTDVNSGGRIIPYNQKPLILDIEPTKSTINLNETLTTDLVINNITNIAAEDIYISYDKTKLEYVGIEEIPGIMLIHSHNDSAKGELRLILASQGEVNIINTKKILLKLKFKGIATGDGLIDITKAKVTDGISLEKNLKAEACGQATITIVAPKDVNRSGAFTLLDLGIDARHFGKDPKSAELSAYETDIVVNNAIDKDDLLKISQEMLANSSYIVALD